MQFTQSQKLVAEALGTLILVCTVVGSGIMADRLSDDVAVTLLGNTLPTAAILFVLITILCPISGAHLNPAVTLALCLRGDMRWAEAPAYIAAQIGGAIAGTLLAHAMFDMPLLQVSENVRSGPSQWLAEVVATFGLLAAIFGGQRFQPQQVAVLVATYITAAYWFTASTSFANPAVAIGRAFTDTFTGIRPADLPGFISAEIVGAVLAVILFGWLFNAKSDDT